MIYSCFDKDSQISFPPVLVPHVLPKAIIIIIFFFFFFFFFFFDTIPEWGC